MSHAVVGMRLLVLGAALLCAVAVAARARWEAELTQGSATWVVGPWRAPVWAPPAVPPYERFQREGFEGLPGKTTPGWTIRRVLRWDRMALDFLLYLWGASAAFGVIYLVVRDEQRDPVLYCALTLAAGLTAAAGACAALWAAVGGRGPPAPALFGAAGALVGLAWGLLTYWPVPPHGLLPRASGGRAGPNSATTQQPTRR